MNPFTSPFTNPFTAPEAAVPPVKLHESGVNAFFRVMSNNLNQFNSLADQKANILISINTVILSLAIGSAARNVEFWQNLLGPMVLLVLTCLITSVIAIMATRPSLIRTRMTREDIDAGKAHLIFFGNYNTLSLEEYESVMLNTLQDSDFLYRILLRDFYIQGKILDRKYRMLRSAYSVFMVGMIVTTAVFVGRQLML